MKHTKLDLSTVIKAHVHLEGFVNQNWTLTTSDTRQLKFYAIEGSPQYVGSDERVRDHDPDLADFLERLADVLAHLNVRLAVVIEDYDPDVDCMDYTIDMKQKLIYNVSVTNMDGECRDLIGEAFQLPGF